MCGIGTAKLGRTFPLEQEGGRLVLNPLESGFASKLCGFVDEKKTNRDGAVPPINFLKS